MCNKSVWKCCYVCSPNKGNHQDAIRCYAAQPILSSSDYSGSSKNITVVARPSPPPQRCVFPIKVITGTPDWSTRGNSNIFTHYLSSYIVFWFWDFDYLFLPGVGNFSYILQGWEWRVAQLSGWHSLCLMHYTAQFWQGRTSFFISYLLLFYLI